MTFLPGSNALILATGGGGDIASAAVLKHILKKFYGKIILGSIPWERLKHDPKPGPIKYEEMRDIRVCNGYVVVDGGSYAVREDRKIFFQASKIARLLNEDVIVVSPIYGFKSFVDGIRNALIDYGLDTVIFVDVGGDIIAKGYEEGLWSPMADGYGLAASYKLQQEDFNSIIAIVSPASDGELPWEYIKERLSNYYRIGAVLRVLGFGSIDLKFYRDIIEYIDTEASRMAYEAMVNGFGGRWIRSGSRYVELDIHSTLVFLLDPNHIYRDSLPSQLIYNSNSFEESNNLLLENGIPTEYEFEKIAYRLRKFYGYNKELYVNARRELMDIIKSKRR